MLYTVIHGKTVVKFLPDLEQQATCRHHSRPCTGSRLFRDCPSHFIG